MSTRVVMTEKVVDGKKVMKARLVAHGFEETNEQRADSPTENKYSLGIVLP